MREEAPDSTGRARRTGDGRPWWLNPLAFLVGSLGIGGLMLLLYGWSATPLGGGEPVHRWSAEAWSQGWSFVLASGLLFVLAAANLWVLLRRDYGPGALSLAWTVVAISGSWLAVDAFMWVRELPRVDAGVAIAPLALAVVAPLMWRRTNWPRRQPSTDPNGAVKP